MAHSRATTETWHARYSDGLSAKSWSCEVRLGRSGLEIDRGHDEEIVTWPYSALRAHTSIAPDATEAIIEWPEMSGAQLHIRDGAFLGRLVRLAPRLNQAQRRWWVKPLLVFAASIIAIIAIIWLLDPKPARTIAGLIPNGLRQTIGRGVVAQLTGKHKACKATAGKQALDILKHRLLKDVPGAKLYDVTVIDMPIINAFATPGGQMVITNSLIAAARTSDEVAGVLAHEIGHGIERHPEASLVRAFGLSILWELFTGGTTGSIGSIGLMVLQTGYIRADEVSADQQALRLLRNAAISQQGLADFFSRSTKAQCKSKDAKNCDPEHEKDGISIFGLLRTHPYPRARLKAVRNSPQYSNTPALSDSQWQALRSICAKHG